MGIALGGDDRGAWSEGRFLDFARNDKRAVGGDDKGRGNDGRFLDFARNDNGDGMKKSGPGDLGSLFT